MGLAKQKQAPPPPQPADYIRQWAPMVRAIDENAELDFSFAKDAITICDMRIPNALRYGNLFTRTELAAEAHKKPGEVERRVREFMR
jgi:hypothetical protein